MAVPSIEQRGLFRGTGGEITPGAGGSMSVNCFDPGTGLAEAPDEGNEVYALTWACATADTDEDGNGFTLVDSGTQGDLAWRLWHKTAGASEPTSYTFSVTPHTPAGGVGSLLVSVSGATDVTVGAVGENNAVDATAPGITTPAGNVLLVALWAGITSFAWTKPADMTLGLSNTSSPSGIFAHDSTVAAETATGDKVATTGAGGGFDNIGVLLAFTDHLPSRWTVGYIGFA